MAGLSYPFDSGPGANVTEDQWSNMMRDAVGTGVHEDGTAPGPESSELSAFSLGEAGIIYLNPGRATIDGFHYQQGGTEVLTVTANASTTEDRIDAIVLRLDLTTNAISLETKLGAPAPSPVPPSITANELLLATYRVRKNSSSVIDTEVTDARSFIGRRMRITGGSVLGREGDVEYWPSAEAWFGIRSAGLTEQFAFQSAVNNHAAAVDPHPQYLTASEANVTVSKPSNLVTQPLIQDHGVNMWKLNLPGGIGMVNFAVWAGFTGVEDQSGKMLYFIGDTDFRPNVQIRFSGIQYKFINSTNDISFGLRIDPTGEVWATPLHLMGECNFIFNVTYFTGPGVV